MINIKANGLGHFYGDFQALKDVTFEIEKGTVVGLVGPNGAGKSTTMKILTGCLVPSLGTATIGVLASLVGILSQILIVGNFHASAAGLWATITTLVLLAAFKFIESRRQ